DLARPDPARSEGARGGVRRAAAARPRRGAVGVPLAAARPLRRGADGGVDAARRREGLDVRGEGDRAMSLTVFTNAFLIDCTGADSGQTGGHGDKRRRSEWTDPIDGCVGMIGFIADGPDEVRRAARENIRRDVDQIKIMASGGAMSPSDELDTTQFTVAEMRAA